MQRSAPTVVLAPGVEDLSALGASHPAQVLGTDGSLTEEGRAETLERDACSLLVRCPLPGTPDSEDGLLTRRPGGAGTGWILLRRYEPPWGPRLAARLTAPRSASLAERDWNLLCRLRAAGVTTPEPMAVVSEAHPIAARRSALVTRELDGFLPLERWLAEERDPERVALARGAIEAALERAWRAGIDLPRLGPEHVWLSMGEPAAPCATTPVPGLQLRPTPEVALACTRGGRLARPGARRRCAVRERVLAPLSASAAPV